MRLTTIALILGLVLGSLAGAACVGGIDTPRKTARGGETEPTGNDGPCAKLEKDVTIRSLADMTTLPKTGCYDVYGKLTLQGAAITSLAGLNAINSVNELDLDHTSITAIDTKQALGIYGKLTLTGNSKLTNLKQLEFETASTGILIDSNIALTSLEPLGLADPKLEEVDGDLTITGNTVLPAIPLGNLTKLTGALTVSGNAALNSLDLGSLATTGHIEIDNNTKLATLAGLAASNINGDLAIRNNPALTSLGTMSALYRVSGNLTIDGNPVLANLAAFTTSIKFVDQGLTITNNPALTDLGALKHLSLVGAITITGNQSLVSCRATEIDKCTQHLPAAVINNNKSASCNWQCN